jgi:hypothetical protein
MIVSPLTFAIDSDVIGFLLVGLVELLVMVLGL